MSSKLNTFLMVSAVLLVPFVVVAIHDLPIWVGFVGWAKMAAFALINALNN